MSTRIHARSGSIVAFCTVASLASIAGCAHRGNARHRDAGGKTTMESILTALAPPDLERNSTETPSRLIGSGGDGYPPFESVDAGYRLKPSSRHARPSHPPDLKPGVFVTLTDYYTDGNAKEGFLYQTTVQAEIPDLKTRTGPNLEVRRWSGQAVCRLGRYVIAVTSTPGMEDLVDDVFAAALRGARRLDGAG